MCCIAETTTHIRCCSAHRASSFHTLNPLHSDSVLPLSTDQLHARPGHGLCGEGFLLLHATDIAAVASSRGSGGSSGGGGGGRGGAPDRSIACPSCGASLGARVGTETEGGDADDVRVWGHALGAMAAAAAGGGGGDDGRLEYVPILERHYSLAAHFALALRGAARRLKKRRFLLRNGAGGGMGAIEVAVWGSEVAVLWGVAKADGEEEEEGTPALRVTYQVREEEEEETGGVDHGHAHGCCDGGHEAHTTTTVMPPPSEALELTLPFEEWHAVGGGGSSLHVTGVSSLSLLIDSISVHNQTQMAALLDASAARDFPPWSHGAFAPARLAYLPLLPHGRRVK